MIKSLITNNHGYVISVLFLITLPLMLLLTIQVIENTGILYSFDIDLRTTVQQSARVVANTVDPRAQANGKPMIDADKAHLIFRDFIAKELKLNTVTLEPEEGSSLSEGIYYEVLVYNGSQDYGVSQAKLYSSNNPAGTVLSVDLDEPFPVSFYINDTLESGNISGSGEGIEIVLAQPGCIVFIKSKNKPLATTSVMGSRWASAKIVKGVVGNE